MIPRPLRKLVVAGAVVLALAAGPSAKADQTLSIGFDATSGASPVTFSLNGNGGSLSPGPYFFNVFSSSIGPVASPISSFCIQLSAGLTGSNTSYTIVTNIASSSTTIGANNGSSATQVANAIQYLYGANYNSNWSNLSTAQALASSNPTLQTAFQLALWELTYDGATDLAEYQINPNTNFFATGSFTTGNSTAESMALSEIDAALAATINNPNAGIDEMNTYLPGMTLVALTSPTYQDQLWLEPTPKVVTTPAPPALLLAGVGFLALVGRSRFTRRSPVATAS